ncbi:hypothetical protein TcCL_ESM05664 [Trypanosoma cruzi]|nr:hypothetical protein TcCL_ESM05664 [Trypanosoma cruzi]
MERCNAVGNAEIKTPEVTEFKSSMYHVHPDYHGKIGQMPLTHSRDIWRARGQYGSDVGGPRQKFLCPSLQGLISTGLVTVPTCACVWVYFLYGGFLIFVCCRACSQLFVKFEFFFPTRASTATATAGKAYVGIVFCCN